jgi:hypothetical protein
MQIYRAGKLRALLLNNSGQQHKVNLWSQFAYQSISSTRKGSIKTMQAHGITE